MMAPCRIERAGKRQGIQGFFRHTRRVLSRRPVPDRHAGHAGSPSALTHSALPSANRWCFQTGTVSLIWSMTWRLRQKRPRAGARHHHDDGDVADLQVNHPVHGRDGLNGIPGDGFLDNLTQANLNAGMSRVAKVGDRPPLILIAHDAGEQCDIPGRRHVADRPVHIRDGKRSLADAEHPDRIHGPESNRDPRRGTGAACR
jgi:hypothetical protein